MRWAAFRWVLCAWGVAFGWACVDVSTAAAAAPLHWSAPTRVGFGGLSGLACPSMNLCVAGSTDGLIVSTDPGGGADTWRLAFVPPTPAPLAPQIVNVTCPSTSFCAGTTQEGDVVVSSDPSGGTGAWRLIHAHLPVGSGPLRRPPQLSCASATLCVGIAVGDRTIVTSTDPGGGDQTWHATNLRRPLQTVACTAPHLCILGDDRGDVVSSTNPAGGRRAWRSVHVFGRPGFTEDLGAAACSSPHYCVIGAIVGGPGVLLFASNPTGNINRSRGAWRATVAFSRNQVFESSACAPGGFCVSTTPNGIVWFPTRSFRTLTTTKVDHPLSRFGTESPSCVSRHWCGLATGDGDFYLGTS